MTNIQLIDAYPQAFKEALMFLPSQTLNPGQVKKLWGEGDYIAMDTEQFEGQTINFWANVSGYSIDTGETVYAEGYSGDISFEPEIKLYEYYHDSEEYDTQGVGLGGIKVQPFTIGKVGPNEDFIINKINLWAWKGGGGSGTIYIDIKNSDVNGNPVGEILSHGEWTGGITSLGSGQKISVNVLDYGLQAGNKYVMIFSGSSFWINMLVDRPGYLECSIPLQMCGDSCCGTWVITDWGPEGPPYDEIDLGIGGKAIAFFEIYGVKK